MEMTRLHTAVLRRYLATKTIVGTAHTVSEGTQIAVSAEEHWHSVHLRYQNRYLLKKYCPIDSFCTFISESVGSRCITSFSYFC